MQGDAFVPLDLTWREKAADKLAALLESMGFSKRRALEQAQKFTGGGEGLLGTGFGIADATPLALLFGGQEGGTLAGQGLAQLTKNDASGGLLDVGLGTLAALPAVGAVGKGAKAAERVVQAPKAVDLPKRFIGGENAGIYRGTEAFGGITPATLGKMRNDYMEKMRRGTAGRNWYDESSNDIYRWTSGVDAKADDMANMLAVTSSRTPVNANLMYANKGWNQNLVGDPVRTGGFPQAMGEAITRALSSPEDATLGLKRSPFSAGLSVRWRGPEFANRPTHDIHDVRAWGITDPKTGELWSKGVPDAGHRFLDEQAAVVTQRANDAALGGVTDWTPYRGQAAAWIAQKADTDGTTIADAARHYGSFAPEYQAMLTREWIPGSNTGHLPELLNAPMPVKKEYSDALESIVTGREGVDRLAAEAGALTDTSIPNVGFYEGGINPGNISLINVGRAKGSMSMDDASKRVTDALAAAHGLIGTQKQVATNYVGGPSPNAKLGAIKLPGLLSDDELVRAGENLGAMVGDAAVPMRDAGGGLRVLYFGDKGQEMINAMRPPKWAPPGMYPQPEARAQAGSLIPEKAGPSWSAKPFLATIDASGSLAGGIDKALRPMAGEVLTKVNELAAQNGWTQAPWFRPLMEGLRDGGLERVKALVEAGVVPVVALTAIGGLMSQPDQQD